MFEISSYTRHTDFTFNSMKDYVCTILHANNLDAMIDWLNDTQNEKSIGGRDIRNMNFFSAPASIPTFLVSLFAIMSAKSEII